MILAILLVAMTPARLEQIQTALQKQKLDGWLFYDFRKSDEIAYRLLGLDTEGVRSRRWYCLIPARGQPKKLVHAIEPEALDGIPGTSAIYASWRTRDRELGAMLRGLKKIAAYRDETGLLHEMTAVCPHLKCIVHWNRAESTWDCPCHGSRFDAFGKVLNGPSIADLVRIGNESAK